MSYRLYIVAPDGTKSEIRITNMNMTIRHEPINVLGNYSPIGFAEAGQIDVSLNALMTPDLAGLLRKSMYTDNRYDYNIDRMDEHLASRPDPLRDPAEREKKLNAKRSKLIEQLLETFKDDYDSDY